MSTNAQYIEVAGTRPKQILKPGAGSVFVKFDLKTESVADPVYSYLAVPQAVPHFRVWPESWTTTEDTDLSPSSETTRLLRFWISTRLEQAKLKATQDFLLDEPFTITFNAGRRLPGNGKLIAPLTVLLEKSEDMYAVTSEDVALFGESESALDAVRDFLSQLVAHLRWLEAQESSLELGMLRELEDLRRYVRAS